MHKIPFYSFLVKSSSGFGIRKYWPHRMSWEVIPPLLFLGRICEKLENSVLNPFGPYDFYLWVVFWPLVQSLHVLLVYRSVQSSAFLFGIMTHDII